MKNSSLNINIELSPQELARDYSFYGDIKTTGVQLGKMLYDEKTFETILAIALIKYHELNGNYTPSEAKIRMEVALEEPEEVLDGCL